MADVTNIVTGSDVAQPVQLTRNSVNFVIDVADTVECALVSYDHKTILVSAVAQSNATAGADWANSLIVCVFSNAGTAAVVETGRAWLEVKVTQAGIETSWFVAAQIVKGNI